LEEYPVRRNYSIQALENTGTQIENPGGTTDSYYEAIEHSVTGKVRLHSTYDGGPDGIQIAGWQNGGADVRLKHYFEGTELNRAITRDRTAAFEGFTRFEGDEYEPSFQIWIYPDENTYSLEYSLAPVPAQETEHCRMKEGMEEDRKKMESATDADMPLGGFMSGLTKLTGASESTKEVELDRGALSGLVENVPIPETGLILQGEENSHFVDSPAVIVSWSCQPE
jgi:hypothetical protein